MQRSDHPSAAIATTSQLPPWYPPPRDAMMLEMEFRAALRAAQESEAIRLAMTALPGAAFWQDLQARADAERQRMIDKLLADHQVHGMVVDEAADRVFELAGIDVSEGVYRAFFGPEGLRDEPRAKTHQRAGITKSKRRGQPKKRRRMVAQSRRRNRRMGK